MIIIKHVVAILLLLVAFVGFAYWFDNTAHPLLVQIVLAVVWFGAGLLGWGLQFAYWQRKYSYIAKTNYTSDLISSIACLFLGPIGLFAWYSARLSFKDDKHYGWKLW